MRLKLAFLITLVLLVACGTAVTHVKDVEFVPCLSKPIDQHQCPDWPEAPEHFTPSNIGQYVAQIKEGWDCRNIMIASINEKQEACED